MTLLRDISVGICVMLGLVGLPLDARADGITHFPADIARSCWGGRAQMYDECGSQQKILAQAMAAADVEGKTVLVIYGAEWCIWCHTLEKYLAGDSFRFEYNLEGDQFALYELGTGASSVTAAELEAFTSENLVLAHIENQYSPDGYDVLAQTGADALFAGGLPFVFTVVDGAVSRVMANPSELKGLEVRREGFNWYRGYNRELLLAELERMIAPTDKDNS